MTETRTSELTDICDWCQRERGDHIGPDAECPPLFQPTFHVALTPTQPVPSGLDVAALAKALHATEHPAVEDCRLGLNMTPRPTWAGRRKCEVDAERLAAEYARLTAAPAPEEGRDGPDTETRLLREQERRAIADRYHEDREGTWAERYADDVVARSLDEDSRL